ncbi:MAG: guanylate kinase [Deltaproteobacteria bacterium]|nr:guanylate kinase [Deltaproteobacteria bacterium]
MSKAKSKTSVLLIVAAPSGTGKSTLCRTLLASAPELELSCSYTTRKPRPGERTGVEYHFVDEATFDGMIARGEFIEWFPVHDHRYGTSRLLVEQALQQGKDLLFDVDVEGAAALKQAYPRAVSVFILPPELAALEQRLRHRGSEDEATIALRLSRVRREFSRAESFDYLVVNDVLAQAEQDLLAIYRAERCAGWRRCDLLEELTRD